MVNVLYNNHYQIVQTPDHVVIMVEMNHDARVIPINGKHAPDSFRKWLGDSIGWWEGDTLVVETVNFHPDIALRPNMDQSFFLGDRAKVVERFTRVAEGTIHYEFTVEDPTAFTQPWRAEMSLNATPAKIYEYACHEGNYSLPASSQGPGRTSAWDEKLLSRVMRNSIPDIHTWSSKKPLPVHREGLLAGKKSEFVQLRPIHLPAAAIVTQDRIENRATSFTTGEVSVERDVKISNPRSPTRMTAAALTNQILIWVTVS